MLSKTLIEGSIPSNFRVRTQIYKYLYRGIDYYLRLWAKFSVPSYSNAKYFYSLTGRLFANRSSFRESFNTICLQTFKYVLIADIRKRT